MTPTATGSRRVVITGVGIVSSVGIGCEEFWESVLHARSGIRAIRGFDASSLPTRIAGEVDIERVDPLPFLTNRKATKAMSRNAMFALVAAGQAARQARVSPESFDPDRMSVVIGSEVKQWTFDELAALYLASATAAPAAGDRWKPFSRLAAERLNPFSFLKNMPNMDAAHISIAFGARGESSTITTGCTAGTHAVGEAYHLIRRGEADVAFAGGTNAFATPMEIVHLSLLGYLTLRNEHPGRAIRSFDASRDGCAPGEGAAMMVLEDAETARRRGAQALAEVRGFAARPSGPWSDTADGDAWEPETSITAALEAANVTAEEIDLVHAFGMATSRHDPWECRSIRHALDTSSTSVRVTSIRPLVGLCGAASGALDLAATVLALAHHRIPPLANLLLPDPTCALPYVTGEAIEQPLRFAVTHAIDLDGQAAAVVLGAPSGERR